MTVDGRLDLLKQHNPFASSSVGDPWDSHYPHVSSINEEAFVGLCHLMAQKTHNPALNCAALILGEVGSGKTHLLGRILAHSTQARPPFAFAYIQPIEDPEQTYRYLLREVMVNLCRPAQAAPYATQLEALLAAIYTEVLQTHSRPQGKSKLQIIQRDNLNLLTYIRPPVFAYAQAWAVDLLCRTYPEMSARFLHVLFQYRLPETRAAAVSWLKGDSLDTADADRLGVPERVQASAMRLEQEARDMLISLGLVLARYGQPLILCFDRLENLETEAQMHAFGKMVEFLVDTAKGMLPIACARGQQWQERFRQVLNQHVTSRLETNRLTLQGCTAEQALALVRRRLASVLDAEQAEALFPFDATELQQMFQVGFHSPRVVIARVNDRLRHLLDAERAAPVSPLQTLREAFDRQVQTIQRDFQRYPPDRDRLRRALGLYLSHSSAQPRCRLDSLGRPLAEWKYIDLVGNLQSDAAASTPVTLMIDVEPHPAAVSASLSRGIDCLQAEPSSRVVYIRDARCPFPPHWKATNEKLQRFKALGGHVMFLDQMQAATWYALTLLSYAVREGDITLVTAEQQIRSVSPDEFAAFIQHVFDGDASSAFRDLEAALGRLGDTDLSTASAPSATASDGPAEPKPTVSSP
jgi:hypothetical protein